MKYIPYKSLEISARPKLIPKSHYDEIIKKKLSLGSYYNEMKVRDIEL